MNIARWSVRNRVAVNIMVIALLVGGIFAGATRLTRDVFPDVSTNYIRITTLDPTTSLPEDIEKLITIPIEERVSGVSGLLNLVSFSQDNLSNLFLEIDPSIEDLEPILSQVRQEVSMARRQMPSSAEEPLAEIFEVPLPLLTLGVRLPPGFNLTEGRALFDRLERELKVVRGVSDVLVAGLGRRELWIEVDPFRAELAGLGFADISRAVRDQSQSWTGGRMASAAGEQIVRLDGEIRTPEEMGHLLVPSRNGLIRLRDIATFKESPERSNWRGRVNLQSGLTYTVVKSRGADALEAAASAREVFERMMREAPEGVEGFVVTDSTKFIDVRIQTVLQSGIQALVIVTIMLVMLLNWRVAVLIAVGLPISFAGTFLVMYWRGDSINLLSLFAMIMAIGMIVDDALVIAENVYRYYESGLSRVEAAVRGTQEVMWPVLGSVSTTVAAFLPLILGEGLIGKFLAIVPVVVISALAFSLVQAFVVLPSHMSDFVRHPISVRELEARLAAAQGLGSRLYLYLSLLYAELRMAVDQILSGVIQTYTHLLVICLRRRYWVCLGFFCLLGAGGVTIWMGVLRFQLFDADYADRIFVKVDLPSNYSLDQTEAVVTRLEKAIAEELPPSDLVGLVTQIGARLEQTNQFLHYGANLAMVTVDVDEQHPQARRASVIERDLQAIVGRFPEFVAATAAAEGGGPPVGLPVNIRIQGESLDVLREIAEELEARLGEVPGVMNIAHDFVLGKPEFVYRLNEERAAQEGLSGADVGMFLQGAYRGLEAARVRWGNDEVRVRVVMDERYQGDPEILVGLRIPSPNGRLVPLQDVTEETRAGSIARINRRNQQRTVGVTADLDTRILTAREAETWLNPWIGELAERYPGYKLSLAGESEDTARSIEAMQFAALLAILLIYVILAVIFNSFLQPLMVMAVIPFGVIGVIGGLLFMGQALGLMAIMGTIALAGIVVNNSVVFVDFINRYRREHPAGPGSPSLSSSGRVRWHSIIVSGRIRFRPIFLTTATTIGGLATLAFATRGQEEFLAPMAQAIIFGLLFSSLITMILIPCLYAILDDLGSVKSHVYNSRKKSD